jgi:translocation and assembly module TamA
MGTGCSRSLVLCLSLLCADTAIAAIAIRIEGVEGDLEKAVRNSLEIQHYVDRDVSPQQVERLFLNVEREAAQALEPYGYYHARADSKLTRTQDGYEISLRVTAGEPVTVTDVRLEVRGTGNEVPAVQKAVQAFRPKMGERLQHGLYEGSKANITATLQSHGYFDAELVRKRVEVLSSANTATIDLAWDGHDRYRYGEVRFPDTQFSPEFLRRYIPWGPDEYYSSEELLKFQQRLVDADYFSAVSVQPDLEHKAGDEVPIETLLLPAKRTVYKAGAYVSTDTGAGVRAGMERRWINKRGHKAGAEAEYAQRLQEYNIYYRIPKPGVRNRNYNFAAGYLDEETDSSTTRTARVSASEVLDQWHGYARTLGLQYLNGDFTIADEERDSSMLFAEAMLTRKRADDRLFPSRGISVTYGLRLAADGMLSDTSLAQVRAEAKWVRPAGKRSRAIVRGTVGAMTAGDFDALPPELRFFAGGDRSIRGFDYQQIGETNATGGVIGGKFLTLASAEYEHYFHAKWGAAAFVDAGDAYIDSFNMNIGAGVGVRWRSPVGIVRLDVAMPVKTDLEDDGVRVHIIIGPDL